MLLPTCLVHVLHRETLNHTENPLFLLELGKVALLALQRPLEDASLEHPINVTSYNRILTSVLSWQRISDSVSWVLKHPISKIIWNLNRRFVVWGFYCTLSFLNISDVTSSPGFAVQLCTKNLSLILLKSGISLCACIIILTSTDVSGATIPVRELKSHKIQ